MEARISGVLGLYPQGIEIKHCGVIQQYIYTQSLHLC